jgi:hypothetical protein
VPPIDKAIFGAASPFQITCLNGHVTLALRGPERHDGRVVPKYGDDLATEMDFLSRWVAARWVVFGRLTRANGKSMSAEGFTSGVKENGPKRPHLSSFLQRRPLLLVASFLAPNKRIRLFFLFCADGADSCRGRPNDTVQRTLRTFGERTQTTSNWPSVSIPSH